MCLRLSYYHYGLICAGFKTGSFEDLSPIYLELGFHVYGIHSHHVSSVLNLSGEWLVWFSFGGCNRFPSTYWYYVGSPGWNQIFFWVLISVASRSPCNFKVIKNSLFVTHFLEFVYSHPGLPLLRFVISWSSERVSRVWLGFHRIAWRLNILIDN